MKKIISILVHLGALCGLLLVAIMPSNKYAWMQDLDPSMASLPADGASDNRTLFALLILLVIVVAELGLVFFAKSKKEKIVGVALISMAISLCLLGYWQ